MPSGPSRAGETFRVRECPFGSLWGKPCRTSLGDLRKYLIVEIVLLSVIMGVASGLVSMVFRRNPQIGHKLFLERLLVLLPQNPLRVGEIMHRRFAFVLPTDLLYTALKRMMTYNVDQLPVLDEGGRVVGVITRMDLIRAQTNT